MFPFLSLIRTPNSDSSPFQTGLMHQLAARTQAVKQYSRNRNVVVAADDLPNNEVKRAHMLELSSWNREDAE